MSVSYGIILVRHIFQFPIQAFKKTPCALISGTENTCNMHAQTDDQSYIQGEPYRRCRNTKFCLRGH